MLFTIHRLLFSWGKKSEPTSPRDHRNLFRRKRLGLTFKVYPDFYETSAMKKSFVITKKKILKIVLIERN